MRTSAALVALITVTVIFLLAAPTFVAFGVAVAGAITWCRWLEDNPDPAGLKAGGSEYVRSEPPTFRSAHHPPA